MENRLKRVKKLTSKLAKPKSTEVKPDSRMKAFYQGRGQEHTGTMSTEQMQRFGSSNTFGGM